MRFHIRKDDFEYLLLTIFIVTTLSLFLVSLLFDVADCDFKDPKDVIQRTQPVSDRTGDYVEW